MKLAMVTGLLLYCLPVFSQPVYDSTKLSPLIRKIVYQIDTITSKEWRRDGHDDFSVHLKLLQQRGKMYELAALADHPNPFVRINTFYFLLDTGYSKLIDIIENHINDTAEVYLWSGHEAEPTNVIEGMLHLFSWSSNWVEKSAVTKADMNRLDELFKQYWDRKGKRQD